jgi:hypothetical protein
MLEVVQEIESLSESQREAIISSPSIREGFTKQLSVKLETPYEDVKLEMERYVAENTKNISKIIQINKVDTKPLFNNSFEIQRERMKLYEDMVVEPLAKALALTKYLEKGYTLKDLEKVEINNLDEYKRRVRNMEGVLPLIEYPEYPSWDMGDSKKVKERKIKLHDLFLTTLLQSNIPLSKSVMLKRVGLDNITHRKIADDVLNYLVSRNKVIKFGKKFIYYDNTTVAEKDIHRFVYELLYENPLSETKIIQELYSAGYSHGYGISINKRGRLKLRNEVLAPLFQHDLLIKEGMYWKVK